MTKKILLVFTLIIAYLNVNSQQCQSLEINETVSTCAIPVTTLEAVFNNTNFQTTDSYRLSNSVPCPPPYEENPPTGIEIDDGYSQVINLGFNFCFYGNTYDQIVVNDNGFVTFDLSVALSHDGNSYTIPNGINTTSPIGTSVLPTPQEQTNAIYACWVDTFVLAAPVPTEAIQFRLINQDSPGKRIFIVDWKNTPLYGNTGETLYASLHLYETSNVIETNIYAVGESSTNNGRGVIGLQNKSGTLGWSISDRTNGNWTSITPWVAEKWIIIPDGNPLNYSFKWFVDYGQGNNFEELFPNQIDNPTIEVNPQTQTTYEARLTHQSECSTEEITIAEAVLVDAPLQDNVQEPVDLTLCESSFQSGTADFDLDQFDTILTEYINSTTTTWNMADFTITYHTSTANRDNNIAINPIDAYTANDNTTIYVRTIFDDGTISCFDAYQEFDLNVVPLIDTTFNYAESIYCTADSSPLPAITITGGVFTIDNGGVIDMATGEVNLTASGTGTDGTGIFNIEYTLTNTILDNQGTVILDCPNTTSATISIEITEDATFVYPATVCKEDNNPMPTSITTSGGNFSINNGGAIDTLTGELDLDNTTVGTYIIEYAFNIGGNCPSNTTQTIEVIAEDDATFSYPNALYCDENTATPTATTTGGTYSINNGGTIDMTTGEIDLSASGLGTDLTGQFTIIYTTTGNCSNSSDTSITIEIIQDASFSFPTDICFSDTTNPQAFDITTSGGIYTVDNGASIDANGVLDLTTTTPGTTYEITYSFSGFCQSSSVEMITVHASPTASTPTTMITECNNGDGTANFDISSLENEIVGNQSNVTLTYHLTQIDAENNVNEIDTTPFARVEGNIWARVENNNGCFNIVEIPLTVENCYVVLPQGFSPNSSITDNQTFNVINLRVKFPKFKLFIYNRHGSLVYDGDNTTENWNGKLDNKGDLLPAGTYFYGIKLNDEQELTYRGWVYLQQ